MKFICLDGKIIPGDVPVFMADNRSFRYGDGLFETMKMVNSKIFIEDFHFERLFSSLSVLNYQVPLHFTIPVLKNAILELTIKNQCSDLCRVRLSIFRGNGNLYPSSHSLNYCIECNPLKPAVNFFNENGYIIGIYTKAQKSCDNFSNIKSANFLPYIMAAQYAEENKLDDCLVVNAKGNIADATIANIFLVNGNKIITPALSEGCINGVMRRYLLQQLKKNGYICSEAAITAEDLLKADEIFLTNALNGIRWVNKYNTKEYGSSVVAKLYKEFIEPFFSPHC